MPNNDDQLAQQYQEILDKYASSLTPPTPEVPETPVEPEPIMLDQTTDTEALPSTPPVVVNLTPQPSSEPLMASTPVPPIYFPPEPTPQSPSKFFKYLFYFSLLVFIAVASAIVYNLTNNQVTPTPTTAVPTTAPVLASLCEVGNKQYQVGQSFPSADSCNTCSCNADLTVICTMKACLSPTSVPAATTTPAKKVVTKIYKDTKYGYQFQCPTTAKYVVEATSVNGNKIPYKQESCTDGESVTTISVYDNTVVHSFGNIQTQISPDKKYVVTLEGDDDTILASFKFL